MGNLARRLRSASYRQWNGKQTYRENLSSLITFRHWYLGQYTALSSKYERIQLIAGACHDANNAIKVLYAPAEESMHNTLMTFFVT